jgi:hypothetical protein
MTDIHTMHEVTEIVRVLCICAIAILGRGDDLASTALIVLAVAGNPLLAFALVAYWFRLVR